MNKSPEFNRDLPSHEPLVLASQRMQYRPDKYSARCKSVDDYQAEKAVSDFLKAKKYRRVSLRNIGEITQSFVDTVYKVTSVESEEERIIRKILSDMNDPIIYESYCFDPSERALSRNTQSSRFIQFTASEAKLVHEFFKKPGRVVSNKALRIALWGLNVEDDDTCSIKTHLSHIRKDLRDVFGDLGEESLVIGTRIDLGYAIGTLGQLSHKLSYNPQTYSISTPNH